MPRRPLIGLALPQYEGGFPDTPAADYERLRAITRRAEALGFDSAWLCDHFFLARGGVVSGVLECLTTLAALAEATERVQLGTLVVCNPFRHPSLLAKMAATIDVISRGRFILGLGAGWHEPEFRAFGYEFEPAGVRVSRLREAVEILRPLLGGQPVSFRGRYYEVDGAVLKPPPHRRPPIWVAGSGPRMLRITARFADGWNQAWTSTPEQYRAEVGRFREACCEVGRDEREVEKSLGLHTLVGRDERDLEARYARLQQHSSGRDLAGIPLSTYRRDRLVGTPAEVVAQIQVFANAGVDHLIVNLGGAPFTLYDEGPLELFAQEVLARL